jgi:hypothetical protein
VRMRVLSRLLTAALLGAALAVALVSCGSSGKGLIPTADAGPLQSDFEEVAQAAQNGNGNCTATTEAINKTERDFAALPASVDAGLHGKLNEGISNLRERALALCAQPLAQTNTTTTPRTTTTTAPAPKQEPTTTSTDTTSTPTSPAPAQTPTTPTATTPSNNGGGTVAPGSEGPSAGPGGGTGIGGESNEAGTKAQEGGK